jgi:DNA-3-methyladenine glycosylase I
MNRCPWCLGNELYIKYHDEEWGVPVHDDRKHFEFLILEGVQAGLSWLTILKKRENYRKAYDNFDVKKVSEYDEAKIEELMNNPDIIRNRRKIDSLNPNDDELKALFDEMKMDTQVRASHILVDTEEEAQKVIERIKEGEDFSDLAKELSLDTASGANGGDLDYFTYAQMVEPFSKAAFSLEIGEVSQPVQSDYGYHIIKLTDRIVDEDITVETKKAELIEYYKTFKYRDLLDELKNSAEIVKN